METVKAVIKLTYMSFLFVAIALWQLIASASVGFLRLVEFGTAVLKLIGSLFLLFVSVGFLWFILQIFI